MVTEGSHGGGHGDETTAISAARNRADRHQDEAEDVAANNGRLGGKVTVMHSVAVWQGVKLKVAKTTTPPMTQRFGFILACTTTDSVVIFSSHTPSKAGGGQCVSGARYWIRRHRTVPSTGT